MIISDFTQVEIEYFLSQCNFTDIEKELFLLRSKGHGLVFCARSMCMSLDGVKKISRKVNSKIIKSL